MPLRTRALRTNVLILTVTNTAAAVVLAVGEPGTSPALLFLQLLVPLPVWAVGFAAAAVLLVTGRYLAGHSVAAPLWLMLAGGAVIGLVAGTTRSPAGSLLLAVLVSTVACFHANGMWMRRRERLEGAPRGVE